MPDRSVEYEKWRKFLLEEVFTDGRVGYVRFKHDDVTYKIERVKSLRLTLIENISKKNMTVINRGKDENKIIELVASIPLERDKIVVETRVQL